MTSGHREPSVHRKEYNPYKAGTRHGLYAGSNAEHVISELEVHH